MWIKFLCWLLGHRIWKPTTKITTDDIGMRWRHYTLSDVCGRCGCELKWPQESDEPEAFDV